MFIMITCKMTCAIESIMPSHYSSNVRQCREVISSEAHLSAIKSCSIMALNSGFTNMAIMVFDNWIPKVGVSPKTRGEIY
jgi:hypothetical protein